MIKTGFEKFQHTLRVSEDSLWASFEESRLYAQRGDIGDFREDALAHFLRQRLPGRYAITSGEIVDTKGTQSGQTDVIIYDAMMTAPLTRGRNVILPAEALLAVVEVKSTLSLDELRKSVSGIKKIHSLRPWDAPYGVINGIKGKVTNPELPRVLTSIFAYESNLGAGDWQTKELKRIREVCKEVQLPVPCLDRVVVLNRGLINPAFGRALLPGQKGALGHWFFHLVNFLSRETGRRRAFPWNDYHGPAGRAWIEIDSMLFNAPAARRATASERQKARKNRGKNLSA